MIEWENLKMKKFQMIILGALTVGVGFLIADFYGAFDRKHMDGKRGLSVECGVVKNKHGHDGTLMAPNGIDGMDGESAPNDQCEFGEGGHGGNGSWSPRNGGHGGNGGKGVNGGNPGRGGNGGDSLGNGGDGGRGGNAE